ncbi:hypothetical protein FE257_000157 [Aspergillus nanangensis]|uniref:Uncharacterized protein n=1 Tax=Aspergillus nanangensis TaxID=2582783 RepID=A0AAD4GZZ7_ASPNN|nr:hypothetical protein FE257_000157 [Aspergillus nanangensis]
MDRQYEDKVILITGAASGIGKATAQKLAAGHATLILCDINQPALDNLQTTLPNPSQHTYYAIDISSSSTCNSLLQSIATSHSKIDYLFNCAGINPTHIPITDTTDAYFTRLVDVNLRGTFNMTRACVPLMAPGSAIVNVSSNCGLRGYPGYSVYCATKFAIVGMTKALAMELGPKGIRVNAVAPGPTDTPTMAANVAGGDATERLKGGIALGRIGEAGEIAETVVFLLSERSSFMNGSVVEVTGGLK